MSANKAEVTICGDNYVLSGDKSEEKIREIARVVDEELRHTCKMMNVNPCYRAAVLTAINFSEKLMDTTEMLLKVQTENHQLDNDVKHYIDMWEQGKKQITDLRGRMSTDINRESQNSDELRKMQAKMHEMENAYFDLQMENVNLKNEIKSIKRLNFEDEL